MCRPLLDPDLERKLAAAEDRVRQAQAEREAEYRRLGDASERLVAITQAVEDSQDGVPIDLDDEDSLVHHIDVLRQPLLHR